jgi:hypothetical protein
MREGLNASWRTPKSLIREGMGTPLSSAAYNSPAAAEDWMP